LAFLAARTRFFDDAVTSALDANVQQVVIVGAGYDSRAWRLCRPAVRFFEVDHPATQRDKRARAPRGEGPTFVPADLRTDCLVGALRAAGYEASKPVVYVVEGLTMYLGEDDVRRLFTDLATLAPPGSRLAVNFTVAGGGSVAVPSRAIAWLTRRIWRAWGEPTHRWVQPEALEDLLLETGWLLADLVTAPALARKYLTGTPSGLALDGLNPGAICTTATRR
jgi:methyltransferase (TIGR00027 family)